MPPRPSTLRRQLTTILLTVSAAASLLTCTFLFAYEVLTFRQATVRQLTTLGEIIAANSTAALAFDNREDAAEILAALTAERHIVAAGLYDRNGALFSTYPTEADAGLFPAPPLELGYRYERAGLVAVLPVAVGDKRLGTLYLRSDLDAMWERFRTYALIAAIVLAVSLAAAYLLSRLLQRRITTPLFALADTARAVTERGDYSVRAPAAAEGELHLLIETFNRMLDQIQELNRVLEQRVQQRTAQLQAANAELEAFSYSVSHDLRAPLRHIDGFAGLLLKADGDKLSPRGRSHLGTIMDSAKQMGNLIDDLLVFSRMGRSEMKVDQVDLAKLVEETIASLRAETAQRDVKWIVSPLPVVRGDRPMLRQVFVNLLANAVKYTRPRNPAEIRIECADSPADGLVVTVRDNGVGFEMEYADKLFGVFQRLHRAEDFEGTGIGLANVRRIVTRHGGRTWAEGQPDVGAAFHFSLPRSNLVPHEKS